MISFKYRNVRIKDINKMDKNERVVVVLLFFLLARLSINSHALGYMENKTNAAVRFFKMSADNKGQYYHTWK